MKNMSKQLKDYLHLYLGAECWVQGQVETHPLKLTGVSYDDQVGEIWCYFENTETGYALLGDVQPILRPLSDMTEEEKKEVGFDAYQMLRNEQGDRVIPSRDKGFVWAARQTSYLLKQRFDLFGLIDAGLAIDKTKVAVI